MSSIALFELIQVVLIQDHPKDVEFLNCPIQHYLHMQNIFGSGVATGRFAMGSSEPLGEPQDHETIDLDTKAPKTPTLSAVTSAADKGKGVASATGKRKRGFSEEEAEVYGGLTKSIDGLSNAIKVGTPGLYRVVMDVPEFTKDVQMFCLNYLMVNKGIAETFLEMDARDKDYWMRDHLLKNNFFG